MKARFADHSGSWVKTSGMYIILILAVLRFVVYPLHGAVQDRRTAFTETLQALALKQRILNQEKAVRFAAAALDQAKKGAVFYPHNTRLIDIQTDVLTSILKVSQNQGMTVLGFETPETTNAGKKITEVPVILKLSGSPAAFVQVLKNIRDHEKTLAVRSMEAVVVSPSMTFSVTVSAFRVET